MERTAAKRGSHLVSDGIATFELQSFAHLAPQAIADALVQGFHKRHDDASCVIARMAAAGPGDP